MEEVGKKQGGSEEEVTKNRGKEGRRGRVKVEGRRGGGREGVIRKKGRRRGGVEGGLVEKEIWVMMAKSQAEEGRERGGGGQERMTIPLTCHFLTSDLSLSVVMVMPWKLVNTCLP